MCFFSRWWILLPCVAALASCASTTNRYVSPVAETNWPGEKVRQASGVLIASAVLSTIHNPVSSTHQGLSSFQQRGAEMLDTLLPFTLNDFTEVIPGDIEASLDKEGLPKPTLGTVEPLIGGKAFFPRLEQSVRDAQRSVDIQVFIFDNDDYGVSFAHLLKEKSQTTRTRVLLDALGTVGASWASPASKPPPGFVPPKSMVRYLKEDSRVRVRRLLNPWLTCDHTKLLITDDRAYLGGMNIGREYRSEWHDLMVELEGPVVEKLRSQFRKRWAMAGHFGDLAMLRTWRAKKVEAPSDAIPIRILRTGPSRHEIESALITAIRASQKRIVIETPYFSSDSIARALIDAHKRGVKVFVILPGANDSDFMASNNRIVASHLASEGIHVSLYPGSSHLKAALVDGWVCVGAANLDLLSLRINRELNISFSDPQTVRRFERELFDKDLRKSRKLTPQAAEKRVQPQDAMGEILADQL